MNRVVKTLITGFVVLASCIVCLFSFVIYSNEIDYLDYEIENIVEPVIKDAKVVYLGDEYEGKTEEGCSYYRIYVTIDNQSNFGKQTSAFHFWYDSTGYDETAWEYYNVMRIENDPLAVYDDTAYFPAGRESTYTEVLCIEDGCEGFELIYENYRTETVQRIKVDL